jgi:FkbM family methyltransferase
MVDLQKGLMTARKGTFVDVGMNLGQTLLAAKAIDPARHYIGFEPNPHCFAYCEQLTQLNQLPNVSLVPIGLIPGLPAFTSTVTAAQTHALRWWTTELVSEI